MIALYDVPEGVAESLRVGGVAAVCEHAPTEWLHLGDRGRAVLLATGLRLRVEWVGTCPACSRKPLDQVRLTAAQRVAHGEA